jgi:branched-chain amino acid transport system permease protein
MGLPSGTFSESYTQDSAVIKTRSQWLLLGFGLIFAFTLPLWLPLVPGLTRFIPLTLINVMCIYIIAVMGLQVMMGYCGQLSIGHAAFMAVGAYTSGLLTAKLGISYWIALPCAGLAAGLMGVIFGASALRLKGFYLVASTLAAQFVIMWGINSWSTVTGGDAGLRLPYPTIGSFTLDSDVKFFYLILICLIIGTFFARNLIRTRIGRAFVAVRDNELAANVMGIRLATTKLLAFFIGCTYAGIAGSLWVHWQGIAFPELFNLWLSIWLLGYLIIGGMASTVGPFFGVILIESLNHTLATLVTDMGAPTFAIYLRDFTFGLIIILFLLFIPRGLAHRFSLFKIYYRLWPYTY